MSADVPLDYRTAIESLPFGKRVGPFLYFHIDGLLQLPTPLKSVASHALSLAGSDAARWNVLKIGRRSPSVSLLSYPGFWRQAFPLLDASAKLQLESERLETTEYGRRNNRPVLHRKELLLPPDHPQIEKFAALTVRAEELGLFADPSRIGMSKAWKALLSRKGIKIQGHKLLLDEASQEFPFREDVGNVQRHKSALSRKHLSQPLQALRRLGYLDGSHSLFDYGCGKGDDLRALQEMAVEASAWDTYFRPSATKREADIVNLGFVVNVIEDRDERDRALNESFRLARKFLLVSALIGNPEYSATASEHRDGIVTSIGTFQKYFLPDELENYVRSSLGAPVTSIAQGVVVAFRDEHQADIFRARRAGLRRELPRGSRQQASRLYLLDENAREKLSAFWERCLALGREPIASELAEDESVDELGLSPKAAFRFLKGRLDGNALEEGAAQRREDILVQFALGNFDGRVYFKYLSDDVQKDVSTFFGNFSQLRVEAKELLLSIANTEALVVAAQESAADGVGYLLQDESLQLHVSALDSLQPILRVYVGCAARLAGGLGRADLVKLHLTSGKVSMLAYDDFDGNSIPNLIERIKVNLWKGRIEYFDYIHPFVPPPLLMKSLFLPEDHALFDVQMKFDRQLMKLGLFDPSNPHPSKEEFHARLRSVGAQVVGYGLKVSLDD